MGFLIFLGGAMFGGCLGVGFMSCLQINRINEQMRNTDEKMTRLCKTSQSE